MATSGKKNSNDGKVRRADEAKETTQPQDDKKGKTNPDTQNTAPDTSDDVKVAASLPDSEAAKPSDKPTRQSKPRTRRQSVTRVKAEKSADKDAVLDKAKKPESKVSVSDVGKNTNADEVNQKSVENTEQPEAAEREQKTVRKPRKRRKPAQHPSEASDSETQEEATDAKAEQDASIPSEPNSQNRRGGTKARKTRTAARRTKATKGTKDVDETRAAKHEEQPSATIEADSSRQDPAAVPLLRFSCPIDMSDRVVVHARALGIDMTHPNGAETLQKLLNYANRFTELPDGKPGRRVRHFVREYDGFLGPDRTIPIDMLDEIDLAAFSMAMNLDMGDVNLLQYDTGEWVASPFDNPWPQNMLDAMQAMSGYPPMRMQLAMTLAPNGAPQLEDKPCIGVSSVIVKNHEGRIRERIEKLAYTMDPSLADDAYDQFRSEMLFGEAAALMQRAAMELAHPDQVDGKTESVITIDDMPDTLLGTVLLRDARNGNDKLRGDAVVIGNSPDSKHLMGRWLIRTVSPYMMRSNAPDGEGINVIRYFAYDDRDERGAMLRRLRKPSKVGNPADGSVVEVSMFEREENATDGNGAPVWRLMLAFNRRPDKLEALDEMLNGQSQVPIGGLVVVD